MQKVVFCFYTNDHEVNLGVGFLSAALKHEGINTDLVIYRDIPGEPVDTAETVVARILGKNPSVIAFSVKTFNWRRIKEVISLLRPVFNGLIIVGGYHAVLSPTEVLAHPGVDGICVGDGELPLIRTIAAYKEGSRDMPPIHGMVFRNQNNQAAALKNHWLLENLEEYPFIDYDIFDKESNKGLRQMHIGVLQPAGVFSLPVITGRGCPYKCTYCSNSVLIDKYGGLKAYLRQYSPASAITNVKGIVTKYNPQLIEFLDETFVRNRAWVKEFCAMYKKEIGVPFMIMARIDILDEPTVIALAEGGLKLVLFGLESGDEEYRSRYLNRKMSDQTIKDGARLLKKYGIMIVTFNMFGMPFETKEMIEKTFSLNEAIEPDITFASIFQPLPGTELAKIAYEHNMASPPPDGMWDLHSPSLDTADLPSVYVMQKFQEFKDRFANQQTVESYINRLHKIADPGK